jgi:hypothetical protein
VIRSVPLVIGTLRPYKFYRVQIALCKLTGSPAICGVLCLYRILANGFTNDLEIDCE